MTSTPRSMFAVILATLLALCITATFSIHVALAQNDGQAPCSAANLKGAYGFNTPTGFVRPDANKPRFVPDVAAGLVSFDGAGRFTGKATNVTNGNAEPETPSFQFTLEGTYTVDADCTGSLTENNSGTHLEIVVVRDGKEIEAIQTDLQETRIFEFKEIRTAAGQ